MGYLLSVLRRKARKGIYKTKEEWRKKGWSRSMKKEKNKGMGLVK
jgi:hypothetical protein